MVVATKGREREGETIVNIGLIGNEPHLKSHIALLEEKGHTVTLLGGSPKRPFPPSVDVFVCRPASTSHNGFNAAMKEKRSGRDVLITNNPTQMVEYIESKEQPVAKNSILPPDIAKINAQEFMVYMASTLGVYGPLLHTEEPYAQDLIGQMLSKRFLGQEEAGVTLRSFWEDGLVRFQRNTIRANTRKALPERMARQNLFFATHAGPKPTIVWYTNDESLRKILDLPFVGITEQGVKDKATTAGVVEVIPAGATPKQYKVEVPAAQAETKSQTAPLVDIPAPTAPPTTQAQIPTPWDAQLRVALGLVLAEMKAAGVNSLNINAKTGAVSFRREVVKIVVEDGDLVVAEE